MAYLGNTPDSIVKKTRKAYVYTAAAAQTIFTGSDTNGEVLDCSPDTFANVYLNGVRLIKGIDFALSLNSLVLAVGAVSGDEITIVCDPEAAVFNTYTRSETDSLVSEAVTAGVNGLIDTAPTTLNTLNELAAALNDDANFASTITSALALKANSSSLGSLASLSSVGTSNVTDGAITSAKLSSTAITDKLGYTPLNKNGDSLGTGTYTKVSYATTGGSLSFDNGTNDTPGLHFYYGNNTNFGIDAYNSKLRIVKNLDEDGGASLITVDTSGNLFSAGQLYSATSLRVGDAVVHSENIGLDLYSGSDGTSYSRIRHFTGTAANNISTIHFFPSTWGASFEGASQGAINIAGNNGVTFGGHNAPDGSINTTRMKLNGDRYTMYGPNTSWSCYLRVGGNGNNDTSMASVASTNGNLHIDAQINREIYLNWYAGTAVNIGNGTPGGYGTLKYGTLSQVSDYRIKENVADIDEEILDAFYNILFKQFNVNGEYATSYGVIAHELQVLLNSFVRGTKDQLHENGTPLLQSVDYQQVFVLACKAVQKQKQSIDTLTNTVNELVNRVAALEAALTKG